MTKDKLLIDKQARKKSTIKRINNFCLHPVKDGLLQFEDLKEKYHQEYKVKEKEVSKNSFHISLFGNLM